MGYQSIEKRDFGPFLSIFHGLQSIEKRDVGPCWSISFHNSPLKNVILSQF